MKRGYGSVFLTGLLGWFFCSSRAATRDELRVDEEATELHFLEDRTELCLALENGSDRAVTTQIEVEVFDPEGTRRATAAERATLASGASVVTLRLEPALTGLKAEEAARVLLYRLHYHIRPETPSPGPSIGIVSLSEIAKDVFELIVTHAEIVRAGERHRVTILTRHAATSAPVGGVAVEGTLRIEEKHPPSRATGVTGSDGLATLEFPVPSDVSVGDARVSVVGRKAGLSFEAWDDVSLFEGAEVLVTTDKPLYQPGQTLHTRLLAFDESKRSIAKTPARVTIFGLERQQLFTATVETSRFGIASVDWTIPETARLGEYRIEVKLVGERWDGFLGGATAKVSRYELPAFSVEVQPDRSFYLPGQDAKVEVRADYLFRKPVAKGRVRIVRAAEERWSARQREWSVEEGAAYEGDVDAKGRFSARIDLSREYESLDGGWDGSRFADVEFAAHVTDLSTGRMEHRKFSLRVTREAIHVYFIEQNYAIPEEGPFDFYVSTFSADGTPLSCDVTVSLPEDEETRWSKIVGWREGKPLRRVRTNRYGVGRVENFIFPEGGRKKVGLAARDREGSKGHLLEEIWTATGSAIRVRTPKTIHRSGEDIETRVEASPNLEKVMVTLGKGWTSLESRLVSLRNAAASITFPYQASFRGALSVTAYAFEERSQYPDIFGSHPVLYPHDDELQIDVETDRDTYRPGDPARVRFAVRTPEGGPAESALGIVVIDRALEERWRTEEEFGDAWGFRSRRLRSDDRLGDVSARDLEKLDTSKPIPEGLDLVAEILFRRSDYYPEVFRSRRYNAEAAQVFSGLITRELSSLKQALERRYRDGRYPENLSELRAAMDEAGESLDTRRDPWGMPYRVGLGPRQNLMVLTLGTSGPDKRPSYDDFIAFEHAWQYFEVPGKQIDRAVLAYHQRTGAFLRNEATLRRELRRAGLELEPLRDLWGHPYRLDFGILGDRFTIDVRSPGPDGSFESRSDDVTVWRNVTPYFDPVKVRLMEALDAYVRATGVWPSDASHFEAALQKAGITGNDLVDPWRRRYDAIFKEVDRYLDRTRIQVSHSTPDGARRQTVSPVTERAGLILVRSAGPDGKTGTSDDFIVAELIHRLEGEPAHPTPEAQTSFASGAIRGRVRDETGAPVLGVTITASSEATSEKAIAVSGQEGGFVFRRLASGTYVLRFELTGFSTLVIEDVPVRTDVVSEVEATLNVATIAETVTVTGESPVVDTQSTAVASREGRQESSGRAIATPPLREHFPETLVWTPSLETDGEGRASLQFRLADNITTWKLSAMASTMDGGIGIVEREIPSFQPFFVEFDPPPVLTEGDVIAEPVILRNYLKTPLSVDVGLEAAPWLRLAGPARRRTAVAPFDFAREIFTFRVIAPARDAHARVTALSAEAADAVAKTIVVRPDGQEILRTTSMLLDEASSMNVDFPVDAIPGTREAELRIYPNLVAHVLESLDGILRRPYGCAEQTLSTGYPGLLLSKFVRQHGIEGIVDPATRAKALRYAQLAYDRVLAYQEESGGFSYWGSGQPDTALTSYALGFFDDARGVIEVDEKVLERAGNFLLTQQEEDGHWAWRGWYGGNDRVRTLSVTAMVARTIASRNESAAKRALRYLSKHVEELDEPHAVASYALAALQVGDQEGATRAVSRLSRLAHEEAGAAFWHLQANSLFYGWGRPGRIEVTALALQALSSAAARGLAVDRNLIDSGLLFLLRNKDQYGVWYTTQATVQAVKALLTLLPSRLSPAPTSIEVRIDGKATTSVMLPGAHVLADPVRVDLTPSVSRDRSAIEVRGAHQNDATVELVTKYYRPWPAMSPSQGSLRFSVRFGKTEAGIGDAITCAVEAERAGFRGYGMMVAEIGLPPGAEVDRASLEKVLKDYDVGLSRYDVLPDRVLVYLWPRAGGSRFDFRFRPRFGLEAKTAPSTLYDYYNPEESVVLPPVTFVVR